MSGSDRPEPLMDEGTPEDAEAACVALVPVVTTAQWSGIPAHPPRSDSNFITHLIATAQHVPQTCCLRRAAPADAKSAYTHHGPLAGCTRTQKII
jgi:hypothetical protein